MKIQLAHRHYGVHTPVKESEIPGEFSDYATPRPDDVRADEYVAPDRDALAAGIEWLYRTVQPDGAIIQHHGTGISGAFGRYYGFCPEGAHALPVITVQTADSVSLLAAGEMAANAEVIKTLGVGVREQWNGDGCISGSFGLIEPAHPSLLAAVARYRAHCPEHESPFCSSDGCDWFSRGSRLIAGPCRPAPAPTE